MSSYAVREQLGSTIERYKIEVIKEPRGIIRILQLVFSALTALVLKFYSGYVNVEYCANPSQTVTLPIEYPFNLAEVVESVTCGNTTEKVSLLEDFSLEAEFLYSTCWISIIIIVICGVVYVKFREQYETNGSLALAVQVFAVLFTLTCAPPTAWLLAITVVSDFVVSVILAVLWIASFGGWAYGQSNLKFFTKPDYLKAHMPYCIKTGKCLSILRGGVNGLTVSVILSFLNFFLWAAGLWFLYKETPWYPQYQQRQ